MVKILYAHYEKNMDYAFIVKWSNPRLGKNYSLIFDCYNDEWKDAANESIRGYDLMDTIDPMDLKMAGSYINIYEDKGVKFPEGIRKEFLRLLFTREIKKNP